MLTTGSVIGGRYRVLNLLAVGGFGQTFVARDQQRPGEPCCVVKQLLLAHHSAEVVAIARRLFAKEAEVLENLGKGSQRIPKLLAHFEENGEFFIVQEFVDGKSIAQEIDSGQRFSEHQALLFLQEILPTLAYVHHRGVIHRDIKPANIIRRNSDNAIFLIDFGAIKQVVSGSTTDPQKTKSTVAIGTEGYMPNEQAAGKPRKSSDIFALGMTVIEAMTGIKPHNFAEDDKGEIVWQEFVTASPKFKAFLRKMVSANFSQRYADAYQTLQALERLIRGQPSQLMANPDLPTLPSFPAAGSRLWLPLVAIGLGLGGIWSFGLWQNYRSEQAALEVLQQLQANGDYEACYAKSLDFLGNNSAQAIGAQCRQQLQESANNLLRSAQQSFNDGNFAKCLSAIAALPPSSRNSEMAEQLFQRCQGGQRLAQEQDLLKELTALKERGEYRSCVERSKTVSANSSVYVEAISLQKQCADLMK